MKHNTSLWLANLAHRTRTNLEAATQWLLLPEETLQQRPATGKWNALECIEHLNRYGDFYLPEFRKRIETTRFKASGAWFRPGWLGAYFTRSMEPKPDLNKMKTMKGMDPAGSKLSKNVLTKFVQQQKEFLSIIEKAKTVDINKTRTSISITKLISLKLGDSLAFFAVHNTRHIEQARKALMQADTFVEKAMAK